MRSHKIEMSQQNSSGNSMNVCVCIWFRQHRWTTITFTRVRNAMPWLVGVASFRHFVAVWANHKQKKERKKISVHRFTWLFISVILKMSNKTKYSLRFYSGKHLLQCAEHHSDDMTIKQINCDSNRKDLQRTQNKIELNWTRWARANDGAVERERAQTNAKVKSKAKTKAKTNEHAIWQNVEQPKSDAT